MNFKSYVETQYQGGWTIQQTWQDEPMGWDRVAVRGESRIEQGGRTFQQMLDALDRIDGRSCFTDFIGGIRSGLSSEDASRPLPIGPDGEPLSRNLPAPPTDPPPPPRPVPVQPGAPIQQSLFGDLL